MYTGDDFDQGRLSSTIVSHQGNNFIIRHVEINSLQHVDFTERFMDVLHRQQGYAWGMISHLDILLSNAFFGQRCYKVDIRFVDDRRTGIDVQAGKAVFFR